ncbi:MAG: N-acetyl-gamma-glutamyl-phosphate reductase [Bacteroidota bacterium]|nr:N-acetyl-gamma-glutamyl-phosphate reductase [Bacteroidota bacterium]
MKNGKKGITASILGASGYSGAMAFRILLRHPHVDLENVFASSGAGQHVHDLFPALRGLTNKCYEDYSEEKVENSDIIFLALPAEHAMDIVPGLLKSGKRVIDLSGDFRLKDVDLYSQYYGATHRAIDLVADACYGLPEINRSSIASADLLSNPGCYPTSAIIPLAPLLKNGLIETDDICISSLSGVTGAGRKTTIDYSFAEVDGSVKAYRVGDHQHIPEIESILSDYSQKSVKVSFVPHLLPTVSGIYSTIFVRPKGEFRREAIEEVYRLAYGEEPFVRYHGTEIPQLKGVLGSNFIDFGWKYDAHSGKLILFSAIDNLIKGAAGQAVQNMNIMCGFQEKEGLIV